MSAFSDIFSRSVVDPWQKKCQEAEYPWMATPELRQEWLKGVSSKDANISLSMAIGLARCAQPSFEEFQALTLYFSNLPQNIIPDDLVLELLITGATPPLVLLDVVFTPHLSKKELPPPTFWSFYANYLRHPFLSQLAQVLLKKAPDILLKIAIYNLLANPAVPFQWPIPHEALSPWTHALKIFHPMHPKPDFASLQTNLERFAFFMRCDHTQREFISLVEKNPLPKPFYFCQTDHPSLFQGRPPLYDPWNPNKEALRYFGIESEVCALYRFYNPLLNYPWLVEDIIQTEHRGPFLGLLLMGHASTQLERQSVIEDAELLELVALHPCWDLFLVHRMDQIQKSQAAGQR